MKTTIARTEKITDVLTLATSNMNYDITITVYERGTTNQVCRDSSLSFESAAEGLGKLERFCKHVEAAKSAMSKEVDF